MEISQRQGDAIVSCMINDTKTLRYSRNELQKFADKFKAARAYGNPAVFLHSPLFFSVCVGKVHADNKAKCIMPKSKTESGKAHVSAAVFLLDVFSEIGDTDIENWLIGGMCQMKSAVSKESAKEFRDFLVKVSDTHTTTPAVFVDILDTFGK
jgi:hypothetical protein